MSETTPPLYTCPRCRRSTSSPFAPTGVCLRCAGARVLALAAFLETEEDPPSSEMASVATGTASVLPDRIGQYDIIEELGRGGMGCIYAARQIGLGRIVALKVLASRGDVAGLDLRFLREAQTVARLHHPHIVAVHDSGRADGYVYFSMEYIAGGDLGRVLRARTFSPGEAATVVEKVAGAVAAAHAEGVLHRDIKPTNILLDGEEPKLADFGLAAQLEVGGDLTTVSGVLGTPHYLAPEALRGGSAALSVESDIYALGTVLFELLTGRTPFAGASPAELASLLATTEPPSPRLLAPAIPRDLETICLKCLEREPSRRYRSAAALAEDLRRFRTGEPILAQPISRWGRLRRLARRHRAPLALAGFAVCALLAGAGTSTWLAVRARSAEKLAAAEATASREVAAFLRDDLLAQASRSTGGDRDQKLRAVLDRAAMTVDGRFQSEPLVEAAVRETLAATYDSLGDYATGRRHLERALILRTREQGAGAAESLHVASMLADADYNLADYGPAQRLAERTAARQRSLLGPNHPDTLATQCTLAQIYEWEGKLDASERLLRDILPRQQRTLGANHPDTLETIGALSATLLDAGRFSEAEQLLRQMVTSAAQLGPDNRYSLLATNNLAGTLWAEGHFAEAERLHERNLAQARRLLGPEHPDTLRSMINVARTYAAEGRMAEALALHRQILDVRRRVLGEDHQETLQSCCYVAIALRDTGSLDEAATLFRSTIDRETAVLGADHPDTRHGVNEFAALLLARGDAESARQLLQTSLAAHASTEPDTWPVSVARAELGAALCALGRLVEAEPLLVQNEAELSRQAAKIPVANRGPLLATRRALVTLYEGLGKPDQADFWRKAIESSAPTAAVPAL